MKITFGVTPYSNPQALADWLQAAGHDSEWLGNEIDPEIINNASRVLLGYHHPELSLQVAMQNGESPLAAMEHWMEQAYRLIACFKANRRKTMLVDLNELYEAPKQACQVLSEHWRLEGSASEKPIPALSLPKASEDTSMSVGKGTDLLLLAREALRQSSQWPGLLAQLKACTLPLLDKAREEVTKNKASEESIEGLYKRWQNDCKAWDSYLKKQNGKHEELQEKNRQLVSDLHQEREKLAFSQQQYHTLEESRKTLIEQKIDLEKQLAGQQANAKERDDKLKQLKGESQLLLEQLHLVQEELEGSCQEKQALKKTQSTLSAEKDALERQLRESEAEVQFLTQQQDEQRKVYKKISEDLKKQQVDQRAQQAKLKEAQQSYKTLLSQKATLDKQLDSQKTNLAQLGEENRLLVEQLHLVQEELESSIREEEEKDHRLAEYEQMQSLLYRRLAKLREVAESYITALQSTEAQLATHKKDERTRVLSLAAVIQKLSRGKGRKMLKSLKREHAIITAAELFDYDWYRQHNPDVEKSDIDPLMHYLKDGAAEGRNPSLEFDTAWYLVTYTDVAESGLNPLVHYIRFGRHESRAPHPNLPALPAP